jgi:hypothetical protein
VIVAVTSGTFTDSVLVTVPPSGNVVATAITDGRSFRSPAVGDTVEIEAAAEMRFTAAGKLGSYNARLTWDLSRLSFVAAAPPQAGDFASPVVNSDSVSAGVIRFASADPNGASGAPILARFRFRAALSGPGALALSISEMSAPSPSFTVLTSMITVTNGLVTVR